MRQLDVASLMQCLTKSVTTHDYPGVQNASGSNLAAVVEYHSRVENYVRAEHAPPANDNMGMDDSPLSDRALLTDNGIRPHTRRGSYLDIPADNCCRVDAR